MYFSILYIVVSIDLNLTFHFNLLFFVCLNKEVLAHSYLFLALFLTVYFMFCICRAFLVSFPLTAHTSLHIPLTRISNPLLK